MAGYSATPQARKLGLKAGLRLRVDHRPPGWQFHESPVGLTVVRSGGADVVVTFVTAAVQVAGRVERLADHVYPAGALWVAWPRKAAGHVSDVDENLIRDSALAIGLVDVKVAAVDEHWSGLKLVWRKENRTGPCPPARPAR